MLVFLFLVLLATGMSSAIAAAASSPELTWIRDLLTVKEDAIIHLTLARAASALYDESATSPQLHRILGAGVVAHPHIVDGSFHSAAPFPPYVNVKPDHARWGLNSTAPSQYIVNYFYNGLISSSNRGLTGALRPNGCTLATVSAAWLETVSERIALGEQVAIAKYNASPANFSVPVHKHDAAEVRRLLTVPKQEEAVITRIARKAEAWQNGSATQVPVKAIVTLFEDYLIPWTTDVEVATLLNRCDHSNQ